MRFYHFKGLLTKLLRTCILPTTSVLYREVVMISFKPMTEEDREILLGHFDVYRAPHCFTFAIAASRGLGAQLVCIEESGKIIHAGLRGTKKEFRDVRGELTREEFVYGFVSQREFIIRETTEDELRLVSQEATGKPLSELLITSARRHAESLWSEWEWKENHLTKVLAFAEELEALCRKYGLWVREAGPSTLPIICQSDGEELGFEIEQSPSTSSQYLFRRKL